MQLCRYVFVKLKLGLSGTIMVLYYTFKVMYYFRFDRRLRHQQYNKKL